MVMKPLESKMQDLIYHMDVGIGLQFIKKGLAVVSIITLMFMYTITQFHGFREAEAMEAGQLGRNLMVQHRLVTQCVRPATIWCLETKSAAHDAAIARQPDILTPPLYPALLAVLFKITGISFSAEGLRDVFGPEKLMVWTCGHLFTLLTGLMLFLLGRRLFDARVAMLGVAAYFLSDTVWRFSISGLSIPLLTFIVTTACYTALVGVTKLQENAPARQWIWRFAVAILLCVLAFLTRYGAVVVVPALALFIGLSFPEKKTWWVLAFLAAFLVGVSPWLARNKKVSGGLLGMAPHMALNNTASFEQDLYERTLKPEVRPGQAYQLLRNKMKDNLSLFYQDSLRTMGDGLLVAFFFGTFFYRFVRPQVRLLRWCVGLGIILLLIVASLFGPGTVRLLFVFWPLVLLYGMAFFIVLLERLQLQFKLVSMIVTGVLLLLGALPLIFTLMPPRQGVPYPPYYVPFIARVSSLLQPEELMCTDMPWATAWYGNRTSILLPARLDEFFDIHDYRAKISGLYFTTLTRDKPFTRVLMNGPYKTWFPILEGRIPADFPLAHGFPINNLDQMFLTDRERWEAKRE